MSFALVRKEAGERFLEAQALLSLVKAETDNEESIRINAQKGLVLVLTYAALECAITNGIYEMEEQINLLGIQYRHVCEAFYGLVLDPEFTAATKAGSKMRWNKRARLFAKLSSEHTVTLACGAFLTQLQNIWPQTITTIFESFAMTKNPFFDLRVMGYITNLVNARNEISHGRTSASEVGKRYTLTEIQTFIDMISNQVQYMHLSFEEHIVERHFVREGSKEAYIDRALS